MQRCQLHRLLLKMWQAEASSCTLLATTQHSVARIDICRQRSNDTVHKNSAGFVDDPFGWFSRHAFLVLGS